MNFKTGQVSLLFCSEFIWMIIYDDRKLQQFEKRKLLFFCTKIYDSKVDDIPGGGVAYQ